MDYCTFIATLRQSTSYVDKITLIRIQRLASSLEINSFKKFVISRYRFSEAGKFPDYFNDPVAQLERMNIATSDSIDGDTDI